MAANPFAGRTIYDAGHSRQGWKCRLCKINVHTDCKNGVGRCTPKSRLLRRQKSGSELIVGSSSNYAGGGGGDPAQQQIGDDEVSSIFDAPSSSSAAAQQVKSIGNSIRRIP